MPKNCCHNREQLLQRARRSAEECWSGRRSWSHPRRRWHEAVHTSHSCCCPPCPPGCETDLDGVLEALARQNQLLLDILGAVNALSAAVLSIQSPCEKSPRLPRLFSDNILNLRNFLLSQAV